MAGAVALDSASLQRALLAWYATHGRKDLPWRNLPRDGSHAYEIYISEIMLQQTQLSRVLESYYFPFLTRFPTLSALADSSEQEVLHAWQGLGYYSRARYMHQTARICQDHHAGMLPASLKSLRALPGIGDYTAGAIWCFGFGGRTHFADSNIARVLRRLVAQDLSAKPLLTLAQRLYSRNACFEYHQALIDLGALICTSSPKCESCPIARHCASAFKPIPPKPKSSKIPLTLHLALSHRLDSIALHKSRQNLYKGLYNLPIIAKAECLQSPLPTHQLLGSFTHAYTKYTITAHVYLLPLTSTHYPLNALPPISNLTKKALALLHATQSHPTA